MPAQVNLNPNTPGLLASLANAGFNVWIEAVGTEGNLSWIYKANDPILVQAFADAYDPLPWVKTQKLDELAKIFWEKLQAGYVDPASGKVVQIDETSQQNIAAKATQAIAVLNGTPGAMPWPDGFYWVMDDNSHVPLNAQEMYVLAQRVGNYVTMLILVNRSLKDAVKAAPTIGAVSAIDVTQGWPS